MSGLQLKVVGVIALLAFVGSGWFMWWMRGIQLRDVRQERDSYERALAQCRSNNSELVQSLQEQNAAVLRIKDKATEVQRCLQRALDHAKKRQQDAALEAGARAQEAEQLRQELQRLSELEACRESWHWTREVSDE